MPLPPSAWDRIIEEFNLFKEAESDEHARLKEELGAYGRSLGFTNRVTFSSGGEPDYLALDTDRRHLFVGEAKATEGPTDGASLRRLLGYAREFERALVADQVQGGIIALATASRDLAVQWVPALNQIVRLTSIRASGTGPDFRVEQISGGTFLTCW